MHATWRAVARGRGWVWMGEYGTGGKRARRVASVAAWERRRGGDTPQADKRRTPPSRAAVYLRRAGASSAPTSDAAVAIPACSLLSLRSHLPCRDPGTKPTGGLPRQDPSWRAQIQARPTSYFLLPPTHPPHLVPVAPCRQPCRVCPRTRQPVAHTNPTIAHHSLPQPTPAARGLRHHACRTWRRAKTSVRSRRSVAAPERTAPRVCR